MTFLANQETQDTSNPVIDTVGDSAAKAARGALSAEGNEAPISGDADAAQTTGEKGGCTAGRMLEQLEDFGPGGKPEILNDQGEKGEIEKALQDLFKKHHSPTEKEREEAKEELADGISDLIPEEDRATLQAMQASIIDGDLKGFQAAVLSLKDNPEKLQAMIKELNQGLERSEIGRGADVQMDSKGNVLLYEGNGNTAIEINPSTGATTLRPIESRWDGSVVLQPGEVLGADPDKVMQGIADTATESIFPHKFRHKPPFDPGNIKPGGDGNGGKIDNWPGGIDGGRDLEIPPLPPFNEGGKIKLTPMNRIDGTMNFYDQ